jgi:hypothetical protein
MHLDLSQYPVEVATAIVTVLVLLVVVAVRSFSAGRVEIKLNDAIIAAIAALLTLIVTDRIDKVGVGTEGVTFEIKRAILTASGRPVSVTALPVEPVEAAFKGGESQIQEFVNKKVPALAFVLGSGDYSPTLTQKYLETLTKYPFFRFVVVLNPNSTLFGLFDARKLLQQLEGPPSTFDSSFTTPLNAGNGPEIAKLPGFVAATAGITRKSDKRDALQRLEEQGSDWLPVLKDGKLDGVVELSQLTASIILDVTNQLKGN